MNEAVHGPALRQSRMYGEQLSFTASSDRCYGRTDLNLHMFITGLQCKGPLFDPRVTQNQAGPGFGRCEAADRFCAGTQQFNLRASRDLSGER